MFARPSSDPSRGSLALAAVLVLAVSGRAHAQPQAPPPAPAGATPSATPTPSAAPDPAAAPDDAPDAATQAAYRQVVTDAIVEFDDGRWAEARALFLRAHELWPSARTLRTLGMTSYELRDYPRAVSELMQALSDVRRPLSEEQRQQAESLIERAKAFVGSYRVELRPAEALVWIDSRPQPIANGETVQLGVGSHEFVVRAGGYNDLRRRINVQGGEEQTLQLELTEVAPSVAPPLAPQEASAPEAPSERRVASSTPADQQPPEQGRFWTWVAAGGAVVLGGTSTALWLQSESKFSELDKECNGSCDRAETDTSAITDLETGHYITLGLAIAAGAGAVVLFVIEGDEETEQTSLSLGPSSVLLSGQF